MAENQLLHCATGGGTEDAARRARRAGDDLGLVVTAIDFDREKVTGGRIEEDRQYGSERFATFDEPVYIGSAIAQLAGHADAVVVDSLDDWARRLVGKFADDDPLIDAEIASLTSVMNARMVDLILVNRPATDDFSQREKEVHRRILDRVDAGCGTILDLRDATAPRATRGALES